MSYAKATNKITFTVTIATLFTEVQKESAAIAKNKYGQDGPQIDRIAVTEDEQPFFEKYMGDVKDEILSRLVNLCFGIAAPVTQDATKIEFVIVDKAGYQEASVIDMDRAIFKAFVNGILAQWLLKVELPDLAKVYFSQKENALSAITNQSVELRKPTLA